MTSCAAGQILCGDDGRVHIRIREERYYLYPEDLGTLFFVGDRVPLLKKGPARQVHVESGRVYLSRSGRAVIIAIDKKRYILPRDRFLAAALGEEISCCLFEGPADATETEKISPHKEGAAP